MTENIEETLMQDDLFREHFVAKHLTKYEFNGKINPAFLGKDSLLDFMMNWLTDYINFPLIEDDFASKPDEYFARKEWKEELIKRYGKSAKEYINNNKLRVNTSLQGVINLSEMVYKTDNKEYPEIGKKAKEIERFTKSRSYYYPHKGMLYRMTFIRKLEDKLYDLLGDFSKD